jgi:small-conductance mechanosensitive channel
VPGGIPPAARIFQVHDTLHHRGADAAINSDADRTVDNVHSAVPSAAASGRAEAPAASGTGDSGTSAARNGPLTGSRAELAKLNAQIDAAVARLDRCRQPVTRLRDLLQQCTGVELDLENKRQRHLTEIGEWLATGGAPDARPAEPVELLATEQGLARLTRDVAAARLVLPDAEQIQATAAAHFNELKTRRGAVHRQVIMQAVDECISQRLEPALHAAQLVERQIWQVADALHQRGDAAAVARIREQVYSAKTAQLAPSTSLAEGVSFINGLLVDPSVELASDR